MGEFEAVSLAAGLMSAVQALVAALYDSVLSAGIFFVMQSLIAWRLVAVA